MKISKIVIKKFRSIEKCTIDFDEICAVVGENNSGKSSVLRALNAFFNFESEIEHFKDGSHQYGISTHSKIEIEFDNIPGDRKLHEFIHNNKITVEFTYNPRHESRSFRVKKYKYEKVNNEIINTIRTHIRFAFIPPNRDIEAYSKSKKLLLHELIGEFVKDATSKRDNINPLFSKLTEHIKKHALKKIETQLKRFYTINHKFDFDIAFERDISYLRLLDNVSLYINDSGRTFKIADCGSGIQSLTMIALYRYLAHLKHSNIVIGIEEPETNLHPQAQRELINSIKSAEGESSESQTIMSTHSPTIIDKLDHTDIVYCSKRNDLKRGFKTLVKMLPKDFWSRYNLEEFKYYGFYRYRNSDFFYARLCVITESKNDSEIVKYLIESCDIDLDEHGVSIINLEGVKNLAYPYYLLKNMGIPYFIIVDKDFFVPYKKDERKKSLNRDGFPLYKNEFQNNRIIKELIPNDKERGTLLQYLIKNHSKSLDLLKKYNIICFRYSLEVDLVSSKSAQEIIYKKLDIEDEKQSSHQILTNNRKKIKQPDILLHTLDNIEQKNYPRSYQRIKKVLCRYIKSNCCS